MNQSVNGTKDALARIGKRLDELLAQGLDHTDEYEKLSEDYQALALDAVEDNIFKEEDDK